MKRKFYLIELFYVLYLTSGYLKSFMNAFHISSPIDITLAIALILIILLIKEFSEISIDFLKIFTILFIFIVWMLITTFYTTSEKYWITKIIYFFTNVISFTVPLVAYKNFKIDIFFKYFILIVTLLNIFFITKILPNIYSNSDFYEVGDQYLFTSLSSGLNILILITVNFQYKSVLGTLLIILNFITLLTSGGRGGIIFTFLVLILYYIFNIKILFTKKILFLPILILITAYIISNNSELLELFNNSIKRMSLILSAVESGDGGSSINDRIDLIHFSIDKSLNSIKEFLFGYGIGSFGFEYYRLDIKEFPHNILLEILFEMGLVGVILFLIFYFSIIFKYRSSLIWLVIYMTLTTLKSSGLAELRIFFGILSLMIYISIHTKKIDKEKSYE